MTSRLSTLFKGRLIKGGEIRHKKKGLQSGSFTIRYNPFSVVVSQGFEP